MGQVDQREFYELHARICKALTDPKRLLIINELRDGARSVSDIAESLGAPQTNVSQHLAVLRERGIVERVRRGSNVYYSLAGTKVIEAVDLFREFMSEALTSTRLG